MTGITIFQRRSAAWLVMALIVFPFSAPLSVCDVGDLAGPVVSGGLASPSETAHAAALVKKATAQAFPLTSNSSRQRRPGSVPWHSPALSTSRSAATGELIIHGQPHTIRPAVTRRVLRI